MYSLGMDFQTFVTATRKDLYYRCTSVTPVQKNKKNVSFCGMFKSGWPPTIR